jgi:hypothetical protein
VDYLEQEGSTAVSAYMVDMYSKNPIKDSPIGAGHPIETLDHFDFPLNNYNNPRMRIMYPTKEQREKKARKKTNRICLNKYSIFKSYPKARINSGHHSLKGVKSSKTVSSCLFHFKFGADYIDHLITESERGLYYKKSFYKKKILSRFNANPDLSLYDEEISKKYTGSQQLVDLDIMKWKGSYSKQI